MKQWQSPTLRNRWAWRFNLYSIQLFGSVYILFLKIALNSLWYISVSLRDVKELRGDIFQLVTQVMTVSAAPQIQQGLPLLLEFVQWGACTGPFPSHLGYLQMGEGFSEAHLTVTLLFSSHFLMGDQVGRVPSTLCLGTDKTSESVMDLIPTFAI